MKIGSYISELLFTHNVVILPGFGTFSKKYIPARFIPEENIVQSPVKIASFSTEPKQGDTPLTAYVANKEGMSEDEVINYFGNLVKEIEHELEAGKKVEFDNIGVVYRKTDGLIEFEPNKEINYLADDTGISSIKTPPPIPGVASMDSAHDISKQEHSVHDKGKAATTNLSKSETKTHEAMSKPDKESNQLPPALKWIAIITLPLIIILIVLLIGYNYFFDGKRLFTRGEKPVTEEVEEVIEHVDEPAYDVVAAEVVTPVEDPDVGPAKPEPGKKVYFIVVGSFRNPANAGDLAQKLREEGAQNADVLGKTHAGFYRTYYGFYYDLAEAKAEKAGLDRNTRDIAWILHR